MLRKRSILWAIVVFMLGLVSLGTYPVAGAAQLTLTWIDNSDNEDGFIVQRRIGTTGTYQALANVGPNVTSYTDLNLSNNITYCYRVEAFNSAGTSNYSNENCATTPSATFTVTVNRGGTGSGTVTSSPAGISCGTMCSNTFASGSAVTLTPAAASGSVFAGWSGDATCSSGSLTVASDVNCTATFNLIPITYTLTLAKAGTGSGTVTSSPAGINCGSTCSTTFNSGTAVTLTATPASGSTFAGWSGTDCASGSVTMTANTTCTATFNIMSGNTLATSGVNQITSSGAAMDHIASTPAGSGAAMDHIASTPAGNRLRARRFTQKRSVVTLTAIPSANSSGAECSGVAACNVTLSSSTAVTAHFLGNLADKIGVYRPSTGEWFLDQNGNGEWDGCNVDLCVQPFAGSDAVPVVGDWNGSGVTKVGLFVPDSSQWHLDANGNGIWDGCGIDICIDSFGQSADVPVVGRWTSAGHAWIGVFRPEQATWYLDVNTSGILDSCKKDKCLRLSVYANGDLPVTGDWTGRGTTQLGFFRPSTGEWFLNRSANGAWNGCKTAICFSDFGGQGDIPVSGDWNGAGKSKIGIFRPSTGEWFLDLNGNGKWDGPAIDLYVPGYGRLGDVPVVGRW